MAVAEISIWIIVILFICSILLIATEKINRAVVVLSASAITYCVLFFIEHAEYQIIVDFLIGTQEDNYGNIRSLILIVSMMMIVEISNTGGLFQFIAFKLIQFTKGAPTKLLITFCTLSVVLSVFLSNILTAIILIPLTITVSRILSIKPQPYVLCEAVLINLGGTVLSISSIPNILIANYAGIGFTEYFLFGGLLSIVVFFLSLPLFYIMYGKKLDQPKFGIDILLEFNVWNFVPNRSLMTKSAVVFIFLIAGFVILPSNLFPPEFIALIAAMILILISKLEAQAVIAKIDIELILYILGIFVLVGGLEFVGVILFLGGLLGKISGGDPYATFITVLWASAYFSANLDNIPITRAILPTIPILTQGMSPEHVKLTYYSLSIGANWGDNLTPLGDNVLVMKLAEQHKRPITVKDFFKIGFITTNYQLFLATIFFSFIMRPFIGIILLSIYIAAMIVLFIKVGISAKNTKKSDDSAKKTPAQPPNTQPNRDANLKPQEEKKK
jgi:Na+/H+ antiporter NhaD/arsenite permease-like protein